MLWIEVFAGVCAVAGFCVWAARASSRAEAASCAAVQLENCMDRDNVKGVRSLLLVRGHLLRREVRDAAQVWLLERENERKDG